MPAYQVVNLFKAATACCGFVLLAWGWWLARHGRPDAWRRTRDAILAGLGIIAAAAWFNFGLFHYHAFLHYHEFFHYFLGSKYFDELGYTRLYHCVAVADVQDGKLLDVRSRWIRDLETNAAVEGARVISDPTACTGWFEPQRWQAFRADVRWFRDHVPEEKWRELTLDHGYNASPAWTAVGGWLANLGPASTPLLTALAMVDPVLLLLICGAIWWAFGWRPLCVAVLWWGTNYPARFTWTGGAFLRTDWMVPLVTAVCLARRELPGLAGASLGISSAVRLFPALAAAGPALGSLAESIAERSWRPLRRRAGLAIGFALSVVLISAVTAAAGQHQAWAAFAANSRKHAATPLSNHVGLPVMIAFEERTRATHIGSLWLDAPWDTWRTARERVFKSRVALYWVLLTAYLVTLAAACRGQEEWTALTLGVGLIPIALNLTSYYYSMLLVFALLWPRYALVGVSLLGLAALTNLAAAMFAEFDDVFAATSAMVVVFVWFATAVVALQGHRARHQRRRPDTALTVL